MIPLTLLDSLGGMDGAVLLACLALAAATLLFIFFIEPDAADSAPHRSHLDELLERRDVIYDNLRDPKFEHRAGKFSDRDFEASKKDLENEAAIVLAEIENTTGGQARPRRDTSGDRSTGASL